MFKTISKQETFWGEVVDVDDPLMAGRIRVRVKTVFDDIETAQIPWSESTQDTIERDMPALGDTVFVEFPQGVAYMPVWFRKSSRYTGKVAEDDYASSVILLEKDLTTFDLDGNMRVSYTESEGIVIELEKNDNLSEFIIRPDNTILVRNGATQQAVHIAEDNISIGRETKSQQPAVVGDDNLEALTKINDEIKDLSETMDKHLQIISAICGTISILKPLEPIFKAYALEVKTTVAATHQINDAFFPETQSKVVTVDKTAP